jgi:hypothetical protein
MATNRADTLDPALLRPGRLDRKIEFPLPSRREKRLIFQAVTSKMNLGPDVDLEDCMCTCLSTSHTLLNISSRRIKTGSVILGRNIVHCTGSWSSRLAQIFWQFCSPSKRCGYTSCTEEQIRHPSC